MLYPKLTLLYFPDYKFHSLDSDLYHFGLHFPQLYEQIP